MNGLLDDPAVSDAQKAMMLDVEVGHGAIYLLDIPVRMNSRRPSTTSAKRRVKRQPIKRTDGRTQRRVLGDVLEPGGEDPYFWASKLHFYITGITFYNFPYTFGFLMSRGLYAMFQERGVQTSCADMRNFSGLR